MFLKKNTISLSSLPYKTNTSSSSRTTPTKCVNPKKTWGSHQFLPPTSPATTQISQSFDSLPTYCWWERSCNSWYGRHPTIYRVAYMSGGCLGFLPSTVFCGTWPHWKPAAFRISTIPEAEPSGFLLTNPQADPPATNRLKFVNMDGSPWRYLGSEAAVVSCGDRELETAHRFQELEDLITIWEPGKLKLWKSPVKVAKKSEQCYDYSTTISC